MSNSLLESLRKDHAEIRLRLRELSREVARSGADEAGCLDLFRTLKAVVIAHMKAEEFALYALVEGPRGPLRDELEHFAFEGYEEHDLIDFLLKEMSTSEEINRRFRAQVKVLADMLERHLGEEEKSFFPRVAALLDAEQADKCGRAYLQERDAIFAKRIGLRPAPPLAPSIHH